MIPPPYSRTCGGISDKNLGFVSSNAINEKKKKDMHAGMVPEKDRKEKKDMQGQNRKRHEKRKRGERKRTCSAGTVQVGFALLDRHRVSKRYNPDGESQKPDSSRPRRHDRPGLVAYLNWASVASGRCGSLKIRMRKQEGEAR